MVAMLNFWLNVQGPVQAPTYNCYAAVMFVR